MSLRRSSVVREIQNRIAAGKLPEGVRLPSERHLASELGVSRTSVQSAIRELQSLGIVSRQANCRPLVAPYPPKQAVSIKPLADQIAVWMLPDTQDWGGLMMLQGIRSGLSAFSHHLLISSPPAYEKDSVGQAEVQFLRTALENPRLGGVITWDTGNPECVELYHRIVQAGLPLVFIDRKPNITISADFVAVNNRKGAMLAVRYLIDEGHRSIAMVLGNDRASSVLDRIDGYETALRESGITTEPSRRFHFNTREPGVAERCDAMLGGMLASEDAPTAIFAVNDRIAFYLQESAKRLNVQIPEQLSLIGFDWVARWMPSGGDLSSVAQPFEEIGKEAARRVLDRMTRPTAPAREILFDAELAIKASTARPIRS